MNITKQLLDNEAYPLHTELAKTYRDRKMELFEEQTKRFLTLIDDIDSVLVCHKLFNASCYLEDLKKISATEEEHIYFIINFIASIGLWGPMIEDNQRYDYGWQMLGNFLTCYQKIRWEKFLEHLTTQFKFLGFQEKARKQYLDRDAFTSTPFYADMARFEQGVILTFNPPAFEEKDTIQICKNTVDKYFEKI